MSIRPADERISFVLSDLQRGQQRRRAPVDDIESRSAAAVAGVVDGFDEHRSERSERSDRSDFDRTRVDAHREPPPRLKARRPCCTTLMMLWFCSLLVFAGFFAIQATTLHAEESRGIDRRLARDSSIRDVVEFGVWDARGQVTALQLQVSVSVALGVRAADDDVHILENDNHFFRIHVDHATIEETEYLASEGFLERLNEQLTNYDGRAVLSVPPTLRKNHTR
jgi:hypothetical protein